MRLQTPSSVVLLIIAQLVACDMGVGSIRGDAGGGINGRDGGGDDIFRDDATICDQSVPVEISEANPPDVLLVVDKSGSMGETLASGEQKWAVMRDALMGIVTQYERGIKFGLMLFPSNGSCGGGIVSVPGDLGTSQLINPVLLLSGPGGATPTHTSLSEALSYYQARPPNTAGQYVLLATDGQPNCQNPADPGSISVGETIASIEALRANAISTYVLGFGDAVNNDPTTLQAMAEAGGTTNYYAATSPAELQAALDAIADELAVSTCTFELATVPDDPNKLEVFFDGTPVPRDVLHLTGWDYDPATNTITFYGASCDQLHSGQIASVNVDYGCEGPIVN